MTKNQKNSAFLLRIVSFVTFVLGLFLSAYTASRLKRGPFPFSETKIVKIVFGICLAAVSWLMRSQKTRQSMHRLIKNFVFPTVRDDSYPRPVRGLLSLFMFVGICMVLWAVLASSTHWDAQFLQRSYEMGFGGAALALTSGVLRYGRKVPGETADWPKPLEIVFMFGLALAVIAADVYFSGKIGLLSYPPYYDGVGYMLEAKRAFLQLGSWKEHPVSFANMMLENRYPVWQVLMILNFILFGDGEWQAYAVRFWPTFVILLTVFWVVRRHVGRAGAWAAVIFTALLPTLSLNLQVAAAKQHGSTHWYLADLRPDLLFAAFLLSAVTLLVENAQIVGERTALLSGTCAALAILTKSSALAAVLLGCGLAGIYVFVVNRHDLKKVLFTTAWALLAFVVLLLPWALAGGAELTYRYVMYVLTTDLPLYSNQHPTWKTETIYYWNLFIPHMGVLGLVFLIAGVSLLCIFLIKKRRVETTGRLIIYLLIGVALYGLVTGTLAKNYFLALPCYLVLWVFSLSALATTMTLTQFWKTGLKSAVMAAALLYAGFLGLNGYRNLVEWPSNELQEGQHNRAVMREIAGDLRRFLSNDDSFMWMPAYGNPATLLYYMPDWHGQPTAIGMDAMTDPPPQEYVRKVVEPAKAVLVYREDIEKLAASNYVHPANYAYFRATAEWVRRPRSSHHLFRSYHFFYHGAENAGSNGFTVDLYIKDLERQTATGPRY